MVNVQSSSKSCKNTTFKMQKILGSIKGFLCGTIKEMMEVLRYLAQGYNSHAYTLQHQFQRKSFSKSS